MRQLDLFAPDPHAPEYWWRVCWDWDGPVVGGYCQVNDITARLADGRGEIYAYMARCRVLEARPNEEWLVMIDGYLDVLDGTLVVLSKAEIWPSTRDIREIQA